MRKNLVVIITFLLLVAFGGFFASTIGWYQITTQDTSDTVSSANNTSFVTKNYYDGVYLAGSKINGSNIAGTTSTQIYDSNYQFAESNDVYTLTDILLQPGDIISIKDFTGSELGNNSILTNYSENTKYGNYYSVNNGEVIINRGAFYTFEVRQVNSTWTVSVSVNYKFKIDNNAQLGSMSLTANRAMDGVSMGAALAKNTVYKADAVTDAVGTAQKYVYLANSANWDGDFYAYYWYNDTTITHANWPGVPMVKFATIGGVDYYRTLVPSNSDKIIFDVTEAGNSNNVLNQTDDLTIVDSTPGANQYRFGQYAFNNDTKATISYAGGSDATVSTKVDAQFSDYVSHSDPESGFTGFYTTYKDANLHDVGQTSINYLYNAFRDANAHNDGIINVTATNYTARDPYLVGYINGNDGWNLAIPSRHFTSSTRTLSITLYKNDKVKLKVISLGDSGWMPGNSINLWSTGNSGYHWYLGSMDEAEVITNDDLLINETGQYIFTIDTNYRAINVAYSSSKIYYQYDSDTANHLTAADSNFTSVFNTVTYYYSYLHDGNITPVLGGKTYGGKDYVFAGWYGYYNNDGTASNVLNEFVDNRQYAAAYTAQEAYQDAEGNVNNALMASKLIVPKYHEAGTYLLGTVNASTDWEGSRYKISGGSIANGDVIYVWLKNGDSIRLRDYAVAANNDSAYQRGWFTMNNNPGNYNVTADGWYKITMSIDSNTRKATIVRAYQATISSSAQTTINGLTDNHLKLDSNNINYMYMDTRLSGTQLNLVNSRNQSTNKEECFFFTESSNIPTTIDNTDPFTTWVNADHTDRVYDLEDYTNVEPFYAGNHVYLVGTINGVTSWYNTSHELTGSNGVYKLVNQSLIADDEVSIVNYHAEVSTGVYDVVWYNTRWKSHDYEANYTTTPMANGLKLNGNNILVTNEEGLYRFSLEFDNSTPYSYADLVDFRLSRLSASTVGGNTGSSQYKASDFTMMIDATNEMSDADKYIGGNPQSGRNYLYQYKLVLNDLSEDDPFRIAHNGTVVQINRINDSSNNIKTQGGDNKVLNIDHQSSVSTVYVKIKETNSNYVYDIWVTTGYTYYFNPNSKWTTGNGYKVGVLMTNSEGNSIFKALTPSNGIYKIDVDNAYSKMSFMNVTSGTSDIEVDTNIGNIDNFTGLYNHQRTDYIKVRAEDKNKLYTLQDGVYFTDGAGWGDGYTYIYAYDHQYIYFEDTYGGDGTARAHVWGDGLEDKYLDMTWFEGDKWCIEYSSIAEYNNIRFVHKNGSYTPYTTLNGNIGRYYWQKNGNEGWSDYNDTTHAFTNNHSYPGIGMTYGYTNADGNWVYYNNLVSGTFDYAIFNNNYKNSVEQKTPIIVLDYKNGYAAYWYNGSSSDSWSSTNFYLGTWSSNELITLTFDDGTNETQKYVQKNTAIGSGIIPATPSGVVWRTSANSSNVTTASTFASSTNIYAYNKISYNNNGGTGSMSDQYERYGSTPTVAANGFSKTGHTFLGWATSAGGAVVYEAGDPLNEAITEDVILYAKWQANTYNVTLNTNGGTINAGNVTSYTYGTGATLPTNVTRDHYTFAGWYANEGLTGARVYSISTTDINDKTYWAKWTPVDYTIGYDLAGGTASNPTTYNIETANFTLNNPTKTGYTFAGWTGTGLANATTTVTIARGSTGNRSYTATWTANTYTIAFDGLTKDSIDATYDQAYNITNPTRTGYTFTGWTAANLNTTTAKRGTNSTPSTDWDGSSTTNTYFKNLRSESGTVTLTANWTANIYTITLNKNGGTINAGNVTSYTYGVGATLPTNVTKTGYTFGGWYDNSGLTGDQVTSISTTDINDKEYWAKWTPVTYTIGYTLNGGTASNPATYTIETASFTLNNPTKTGYTFAGWTGTGLDSATTTVTITNGSTGNRSYTATWTANTYTISYAGMDGASYGTSHPTSGTYDAVVTINNPSKTGYEFAGWTATGLNTSTAKHGATSESVTTAWSNGNTKVSNEYFKNLRSASGTVTLTATWTANNYTITLNVNGGSGNTDNVSATYDSSSLASITNPSKTGYEFAGWTKTQDGTDLVINTSGAFVNGTTYVSEGKWHNAGNATLYAKWTANTYTINYAAGSGGSGSMSTTAATYDAEVQLRTNTFTAPTGKAFGGWILTGTNTSNAKYGASGSVTNAITAGSTVIPNGSYVINLTSNSTGSVTLTAQWVDMYVVTYELHNGSEDIIKYFSKTDTPALSTDKPTNPTRTGYTFKGWYTLASGGSAVDFSATASTRTIHAQWTLTNPVISSQPSAYSGTYNSTGHTLSVTATHALSGTYSLTYQWYKDDSPVAGATSSTYVVKDVNKSGSYKCIVSITDGEQVGNVTSNTVAVTISKANITPTVSMAGWTYGETASNPSVSGNTGSGAITYTYQVNQSGDWVSDKPTTAGTHNVKATIAATDNYNGATATANFTISKADISPSVSMADWTYGNTASSPSVTGNTGSGTVTYEYKVQGAADNTYSTTKPSNAGNYTVRATIAATTNYNGATGTANFTISKANITPTVSISGWNYGATASNPSVSGNTGSGAVTYHYKAQGAGDGTYSTTKPSDAGNYTVRATIAATTNYNGATATANFAIKGKVVFNANGGSSTPSTQYQTIGSTVTLPAAISRTGYTFAGWNTNSSGTGTNYNAGASYTISANTVTLYATFETTIYYTNSDNWGGTINAYLWNAADDSIKNANWPGVPMTYVGQNGSNQAVYKLTIKGIYDRVIFNNASSQTSDITIDQSTYNAYYNGGRWNYKSSVTFNITYNDGTNFYIAGTFSNWNKINMNNSNGNRSITIVFDSDTSSIQYKFVNNNNGWESDPNRTLSITSSNQTVNCSWR